MKHSLAELLIARRQIVYFSGAKSKVSEVGAMNHEKVPYPPAYTEIYPAVPVGEMNPQNMGWQQPNVEVVMPQQPPASYGTVISQQPGMANQIGSFGNWKSLLICFSRKYSS